MENVSMPEIYLRYCITGAILLLIVLVGCDSERLLSYNYQAQDPPKISTVHGSVRHSFSNIPLVGAQVEIDSWITQTDWDGNFSLNYFLSVDDQYNRPVPFIVSLAGYYPIDSTIIILPNETPLFPHLVRASPVILSATLTPPDQVQATVFDYQGIETIDTVIVSGQYIGTDPNSNRVIWRDYPLNRQITVDANTARYSGELGTELPGFINFTRVRIYARDKEGFEIQTEFIF